MTEAEHNPEADGAERPIHIRSFPVPVDPPAEREQAWLDDLPAEFTEDWLEALTDRQVALLSKHATLDEDQRAGVSLIRRARTAQRLTKSVTANFGKSLATDRLGSATRRLLPDTTSARDSVRAHDELMKTLREIPSPAEREAKRDRRREEREDARSQDLVEALTGVHEELIAQSAANREAGRVQHAVLTFTLLGVLIGSMTAVSAATGAWWAVLLTGVVGVALGTAVLVKTGAVALRPPQQTRRRQRSVSRTG